MAADQMSRLAHPDAGVARGEKLVAIGILAVPVVMLVLFAVGEMAGGEVSGAQHLVQAAPLVALAVLGWYRPRIAGWLLLAVAVLLAVIYPVFAELHPAAVIVGELLLFIPPIVAGVLLIFASRAPGEAH